VGEHFGDSDHNSVRNKLVMENDKDGLEIKLLNWAMRAGCGVHVWAGGYACGQGGMYVGGSHVLTII